MGMSWPNSRDFWQHKPDSHNQPRAALGCGARTPISHSDAAGPLLRRGAPGGRYSCTRGSRDRPPAPALTAPPCPARRCCISSVPAAPGQGRRWRPRGVACPGPSAEARRHRRDRKGRRCREAAAPSSSSRTRRSSSSRSRNAGTVPSKEGDGGKHWRAVPCLRQGQGRGAHGCDLDSKRLLRSEPEARRAPRGRALNRCCPRQPRPAQPAPRRRGRAAAGGPAQARPREAGSQGRNSPRMELMSRGF